MEGSPVLARTRREFALKIALIGNELKVMTPVVQAPQWDIESQLSVGAEGELSQQSMLCPSS